MDYRVKEDSLDEDSMSSSKLSPTELSKNVDDHENEENMAAASARREDRAPGGPTIIIL